MDILIIIPARGGSKRIPKKNIALLAGKPLLAYTLEAIKETNLADNVIVSTDDDDIAATVARAGVRALHRPKEICVDNASTESALLHALHTVREEGYFPDWIMTLPPTSPFRTAEIIRRFVEALDCVAQDIDCIMSVTENRGDFWLYDADGQFRRLFPDAPRRQQDRQPLFEENSALYLTRTTALESTGSILGCKVLGIPISAIEGFDINTPEDLKLADAIMRRN
ncbi:cytidylyltransferase domain-containing protein [Paludibacterium purpuratum]|uniref:N-acylneuraminate cytidylyltransferase n=1 Tax=Paludibacterium purpuratum TaxID=1144873 RepID=A0A4R7B3H1_9NEIS|nr:acylneuraminate cytidylyltransferase family protein [Paludibacterium purpuratum]TDR76724.1 N-acylneuraminate cytidylyltransferase [Paludibacterium purpuratum]